MPVGAHHQYSSKVASAESGKDLENEPITPAEYDFEKMIEEAMKKAGEKPAVGGFPTPGKIPNPKGAGAVASDQKFDQNANDEDISEGGGQTSRQ